MPNNSFNPTAEVGLIQYQPPSVGVGLIQALGLMSKYFAIVVFALVTGGCASWQTKPQMCFTKTVPPSPYTASDLKALASVKSRLSRACGQSGVECHLELRHKSGGEIEVTASRAFVSGDPPKCKQLEGGFETYVFSPQGNYIRVVLGL